MDSRLLFDRNILGFFSKVLASRCLSSAFGLEAIAGLAFLRRQALRRISWARRGRTVPPILIASLTRRCNLDCVGCYSKALRPGEGPELSDDRFMELFREAIDLGVAVIMLAGGEPFLRRGLLERATALPGVFLPVFTNGTLLDESTAGLFSGSRLVPVFSIEGDTAFTAERRGRGVHESVIERATELAGKGTMFGLSLTLTSKNADRILERSFLEEVGRLGPSVLFLIEYVPVRAGTEGLVLEPAQKAALADESRFEGLAFGVVQLPGDEEAYGGCLAAGRGFVHLAADGRVEACPFAPYSDSDAGEAGLGAALDSPLLRAIRERHSELTETRGGCALWNKRGWIATLGACAGRGQEVGAA
jgi:MoaA/NifB/PqqE/SkfB family radical SAM enzyme